MNVTSPEKSRFIPLMMLALLAWGCMLALGTFLYRINQGGGTAEAGNLPIYRGLIVLVCTLAFLGLWLLALAFRRKRPQTSTTPPSQPTSGN